MPSRKSPRKNQGMQPGYYGHTNQDSPVITRGKASAKTPAKKRSKIGYKLPRKELSAFLGFTNYYRDFLPGFANVTAELNSVKNNRFIVWTPEMTNNFNTLKDQIVHFWFSIKPSGSPAPLPSVRKTF